MIKKRPGKHGMRYFFSPGQQNAPVEIQMVGVDTPPKKYSVNIDIHELNKSNVQFYQFEYVSEGKLFIETDDSVSEVSEGEFFLISKNIPRKLYTKNNTHLRKIYLSAKGSFIDAMVKSYGLNDSLCVIKSDVSEHFHAILDATEKAEDQTTELCDFIVCELLRVIQKVYKSYCPDQTFEAYKIAHDIATYIADNLHRNLSLKELCDQFFMGETHLIKIFKARYKLTPMAYTQKLRVTKAKNILLNSDTEISKISEMCGFTDSGYFAKVFKKYYGNTPLSFKKNFQNLMNPEEIAPFNSVIIPIENDENSSS